MNKPLLEEFSQNIYILNGPTVNFMGFPYPTRMAVIKLSNGSSFIWSPINLTKELAEEIETNIGKVSCIVVPNKIHHLFLKEWSEYFPNASIFAPPGLRTRNVVEGISFEADLSDEPELLWKDDIEQVVFRGSFFMEEVVFFHKVSKTIIVGDLIQRHEEETCTGFLGCLMKLDGIVGDDGSTPRDYRLTFLLHHNKCRASLDKIIAWDIDRMIIAHGSCCQKNGKEVVRKAFDWVGCEQTETNNVPVDFSTYVAHA